MGSWGWCDDEMLLHLRRRRRWVVDKVPEPLTQEGPAVHIPMNQRRRRRWLVAGRSFLFSYDEHLSYFVLENYFNGIFRCLGRRRQGAGWDDNLIPSAQVEPIRQSVIYSNVYRNILQWLSVEHGLRWACSAKEKDADFNRWQGS